MLYVPFLILCLDVGSCSVAAKKEPLTYKECVEVLAEGVEIVSRLQPELAVGGLCVPLGGDKL